MTPGYPAILYLLALGCLLGAVACAPAATPAAEEAPSFHVVAAAPNPWTLTASVGQLTGGSLIQALLLSPGLMPSTFVNAALSREFLSLVPGDEPVAGLAWVDRIGWEFEINIGKHFGLQDHAELNSALVFRLYSSHPGPGLRSSVAVGEGVSVASDVPKVEFARHAPATARVLNYLMFEVTLGPLRPRSPEIAFRIHHRSGVGGLINGAFGASNVVLVGVKLHF